MQIKYADLKKFTPVASIVPVNGLDHGIRKLKIFGLIAFNRNFRKIFKASTNIAHRERLSDKFQVKKYL